jgi:hypothetical protein
MKLHSFVSCILAACSLVVFPELSQGHGGGGGGSGSGGGGGGHVAEEEVLVVMDLADLSQG